MQQKIKSEHTKRHIMDQAFMLFYKNGFKTTSIDKIVAAANLTKGAFYHHFDNKMDLGKAIIEVKLFERLHAGMIVPLFEPGNAFSILKNTFSKRMQSFNEVEKKHGCPLNNLINEIGDKDITYQLALKKVIEQWKSALIHLIDKGKEEKTIKKNVSSKAVAMYLISAFEGMRGIRKLYDDDKVLAEYSQGLTLFLNQIKA